MGRIMTFRRRPLTMNSWSASGSYSSMPPHDLALGNKLQRLALVAPGVLAVLEEVVDLWLSEIDEQPPAS